MTRINTNVSSLIAQNTLQRSNADLQVSLTRLSTGLRINTGKDDPAGLIASENLRRDITSIEKAISNSERANQLIATADSALGQVSSLLNDIRGLVTEAANSGALSDEQIAANQLQVDSSLEAIDRIAQVTTFQGRKILDGSLDFITSAVSGFDTVSNLQIDQASLGSAGSVSVSIEVATAATQAQIDNTGGVGFTAGTAASGTVTFTDVTVAGTASSGSITFTDVTTPETLADEQFTFTSTATLDIGIKSGHTDTDIGGAGGNAVTVTIQSGDTGSNAHATASYDAVGNALTITVDNTDNTGGGSSDNQTSVAISDIITALNSDSNFTDNFEFDSVGSGNFTHASDGSDVSGANLTGGVTEVTDDDVITVTSKTNAAANDRNLTFTTNASVAAGTVDVQVTATDITITVNDNDTYDLNTLAGLIDTQLDAEGYDAALSTNDADGSFASAADSSVAANVSGGVDDTTADDVITIDAAAVGAAFNGTVTVQSTGAASSGIVAANTGGDITITIENGLTANIADIATAIDDLDDFTASVTTNNSDGQFVAGTDTDPTGTLAGGADDSGAGLGDDLVVEIGGATGSEVFTFEGGTTLTQIISAVNLVSDATGVEASNNGGDLQLNSTAYGSSALVDVNVISEGASGTFAANLSATRANGTDIDARVNGVQAKGDGNAFSINTATLDLTLTVNDGSSTDISFNITGGGALFQLGPDVVSNQQARLGIQSVNTARLGGSTGELFQLRSGGVADLTTDATTAASIVDEAITRVTSLRGRLGAFQKTTLETNIFSLNDTLSALTEAESSIRDADFAAESARLTRAQILVQSGTSVLAIANSNPQNVLALLR